MHRDHLESARRRFTREESTHCILHIMFWMRRSRGDEIRGKATARLPFFLRLDFSKFVAQSAPREEEEEEEEEEVYKRGLLMK